MAKSFQEEIPRSRVNITLDLETAGAGQRRELPLKMLVMGDYSKRSGQGRVRDRERPAIRPDTIESTLNDLSPRVRYSVPNTLAGDGSEIDVDLSFHSLKSFLPQDVARRIPQVNNMLAMRNLLKDLKSNLLDNGRFRRELEGILKEQPELQALMAELERLAPLDESVQDAGEATTSPA